MTTVPGAVPAPPTGTVVQTTAPTLPRSVLHAATRGAPLFSWWVPTLIALGTVALTVTCFVVRRRRTRSRGSLVGICAGALTGIAVATAAGVNVYAGYLPTVSSAQHALTGAAPARPPAVRVQDPTGPVADQSPGHPATRATTGRWELRTEHLSDPRLDIKDRTVIVALPPGYGLAGHRYPTAYLLSGYPGRAADWFDAGRALPTLDALVAARLSPYYVLVMPDVNGGFLNDSEGLDAVAGPQVATWLTTDVVRFVDRHFATLPDRSERVIAGMSSGGYEALNLSLRHQDTYGISLALEPYGDPGNVRARLLGGSLDLLHANSPSWYVPSIPLHRVIDFFFDSGSGHTDADRTRQLAALIAHRHEPVTLRVESGQGHTWAEAAAGLPYALAAATPELGSATLRSSYPPSAFPPGHRTKLSLLLSPDAEKLTIARLTCERQVHTPPGPQRQAAVTACLDARSG